MKSIKIILFAWLLLNTNLLHSQTWPKFYGEANRIDRPWDIIETYDKGYLILGNYPEFSWLIKTDINGNILWEKIIDNEPNPLGTAVSIEPANDGGVLVGGIALSGYSDKYGPFVMKLNACGEKEWCKIFEGSPNASSWVVDVKEIDSGDIVVLVSHYGTIPEETIHLFKLTADGDVLWQEAYATTENHPGSGTKSLRSLTLTADGDYLISANGYWEHPWNPGGGYYARPLIIKVNSDGNEQWVLPFGLKDTLNGWANHTMEYMYNSYVSVGLNVPAANVYNGLIMSFDDDGNELGYIELSFEHVDPNTDGGTLRHISKIDSLYLLGADYGDFFSPDPWPPGEMLLEDIDLNELNILGSKYYPSNRLPYALTTIGSGKYLSTSTFRHSATNYDIFLAKNNLNLEYDTAYGGNFTYDSLCVPGPPQSGFIYLANCDIVTSIDMPSAGAYREKISHIPLSIYPNPATDRITFDLENTDHHRNIELRCINLLGLQHHHTSIYSGQKQVSANVSAWPPGMYIAVVYSNGKPVGREKFVVR